MRNKRIRTLALLLCLCLLCLPLMGMAASGESSGDVDSGEPEPIVIDIMPEESATPEPEIVFIDIAPEETEPPATEPEETAETPAPVCICESKCNADTPNADCPVCSVNAADCTGQEPILAPVCVCETKCADDTRNADCPVCSVNAAECQGKAPDPDFTIRIIRPDGWYTDKAVVIVRVDDENKTGWEKVEVKIEKNGAWTDLTDELEEYEKAEVIISENCTVYVTVTDKDGKTHTKNVYIECFDRDAPTLRAGIDGELLRVEADDDLSGVAYIYVNGYRFTGLVNGTLDVDLKSYADEYEQMSIVAVDYAGNRSKTVQVKNPYYGETDNEDEHDGHCADDCDCRDTETPTPTPTPTQTTKPTVSSGGGNASTVTTTPTPTDPPADSDEAEDITITPGTGFTQNGNAVVRDLLYDEYTNKQFIAVETKDGNTFYVVIDYDKPIDEDANLYETYFLNLVDNADLMALLEDGQTEEAPAVCSCTDKCEAGAVNTDCAVCSVNMSECAGKEAVTTTPEPEQPDEPEEKSGGSPLIILLVLLLIGGGGALVYIKVIKPKQSVKGGTDLDELDFDEDDGELYEPEETDGQEDNE